MINHLFSSAGEVLTLFLIPIGGGIPAGVILAKNRGLEWPVVTLIYFLSDLILACVFEPLMHWFIKTAKHSQFMLRWIDAYKVSLAKAGFKNYLTPSPFSLIMLSFGVDPMTGRVVSHLAGHGFIPGWMFAIAGDMIFFALIMASTLWLNSILGDGMWTAIIIMTAMIVIPALIRRWKSN